MTKIIVALALSYSIAIPAFAENKTQDPRFTLEMAKREYANGTLPTAADVVGDWIYVGYASKESSVYYPDGKYLSEGTLGQYVAKVRELESFPAGTARFLIETFRMDLDAGKGEMERSFKATANGSGLRYFNRYHSINGDTNCIEEHECRMAQTPKSFVCAYIVSGNKECAKAYGKDPYNYIMFVR